MRFGELGCVYAAGGRPFSAGREHLTATLRRPRVGPECACGRCLVEQPHEAKQRRGFLNSDVDTKIFCGPHRELCPSLMVIIS